MGENGGEDWDGQDWLGVGALVCSCVFCLGWLGCCCSSSPITDCYHHHHHQLHVLFPLVGGLCVDSALFACLPLSLELLW